MILHYMDFKTKVEGSNVVTVVPLNLLFNIQDMVLIFYALLDVSIAVGKF